MIKFRPLKANEIECRIGTIKSNGLTILLYKDARVDQNILDETVGNLNWQRHHSRDNANCTVSIWDEHKKQWIDKEDTGTESFTEKEKGLASDSFKRACFNWGIGRELYTSPFIWISSNFCNITAGDKPKCYDRFRVSKIEISDGVVTALQIVNDSRKGQVVFSYGLQPEADHKPSQAAQNAQETVKIGEQQLKILQAEMKVAGVIEETICKCFGIGKLEDMTAAQYVSCMKKLKATIKSKGE